MATPENDDLWTLSYWTKESRRQFYLMYRNLLRIPSGTWIEVSDSVYHFNIACLLGGGEVIIQTVGESVHMLQFFMLMFEKYLLSCSFLIEMLAAALIRALWQPPSTLI